jgi:hypothetical protein
VHVFLYVRGCHFRMFCHCCSAAQIPANNMYTYSHVPMHMFTRIHTYRCTYIFTRTDAHVQVRLTTLENIRLKQKCSRLEALLKIANVMTGNERRDSDAGSDCSSHHSMGNADGQQ